MGISRARIGVGGRRAAPQRALRRLPCKLDTGIAIFVKQRRKGYFVVCQAALLGL
jgi:hypothetical protein